LTANLYPLPFTRATGSAKGRSGQQAAIGPNDRFAAIRLGGHVITPIGGETFTIGTVQVRVDYKARKRHGIPADRAVPASQIHRDVYSTILEAARGVSRGSAKYDAVEVPAIEGTEGAIAGLYRRHLIIDPHDDAQAAAWKDAVMGAAQTLGMNVEDARKLKVIEALMGVSDVHDSSGKTNIERASLAIMMMERLLRERRGDITIKKWRMSQDLVSITNLIQSLFTLLETMDRVAFQAFMSDPLTGSPGMIVRQDNAARFWRQHAEKLRRIQVRPFGGWFFTMSAVLNRAATAMEDGNIGAVLVNMQRLQAVAAIAKARMAVERVLVPVAEMHDISRHTKTEDGAWRMFSESWATTECASVLQEWATVHGPKAAPLSKSGTADMIGDKLRNAHMALSHSALDDGYGLLRDATKLLERNIVLE